MFLCLMNKLDFYGTKGNVSLPICSNHFISFLLSIKVPKIEGNDVIVCPLGDKVISWTICNNEIFSYFYLFSTHLIYSAENYFCLKIVLIYGILCILLTLQLINCAHKTHAIILFSAKKAFFSLLVVLKTN